MLLSLTLSQLVSPWWLLIAGFVGANLLQASLTQWCLLVTILRELHVPECGALRDRTVVA